MTPQHPFPKAAAAWLADKAFQVMPLKATRPWPGQPDYWIEVVVAGGALSPIVFMRATAGQATGKRGRHTAYCGTGIEIGREATAAGLDDAYRHFLALNQAAVGALSGLHKYPLDRDGERAPPAVTDKK